MSRWIKGCHAGRCSGLTSPAVCIFRVKSGKLGLTNMGAYGWLHLESMDPPLAKRRRTERPQSPVYKLDDEDDYQPYVPIEKRRQERLAQLTNRRGPESKQERAKREREEREEREDEEREEERRREKARKERTLLMEAQDVHSRKAAEGAYERVKVIAFVDDLPIDAKKTDQERAAEADAEILTAIASRKKLASDLELARGINYTESLKTTYVTVQITFTSHLPLTPDGGHHDTFAKGPRSNIASSKKNITS